MSPYWQRIVVSGIIGTILFGLMLHASPLVNGPPLNVALWDGAFLTLNFTVATIIGYILELAFGVGLAVVYAALIGPRLKAGGPMGGLLYGFALWLLFMVIGLPLFGVLSPLVQNGLMLSPGFFAWHLGFVASLVWLLALEAYGGSVGYLMGDRAAHRPSL